VSELREATEQYLAVRRSLGFQLRQPEATLRTFVAFAQEQGADYITVDLMLRWAKTLGTVQASTRADWLAMVRRFALWRSTADSRTEVPPENLMPARYRRKAPYIYKDEEVERLVRTAEELPSPAGLRGLTYSTFFGLIAVTGMRISEALALDRDDIDLEHGVLTIRQTKFGQSRLVPIHSSTIIALQRYAQRRDLLLPRTATPAFFLAERGTRITQWSARYNFAKVSQRIDLRTPTRGYGRGPRVHDLRHRFAVRTLIDWYRAGLDVEREIPKLATFLGHAHVNDTYWYLEAVPELLQLATDRLRDRSLEELP